MKIKFTLFVLIAFTFNANAQIYTPSGTIQGTSGNDYVGIGTNTPLYKLNVYGSHHDSRILLHSIGGGDDARQADLMLWASEPGWTYTGTGIGNNVKNEYNATNGMAINRLNLARGGSYIRFLDNEMFFNIVSSSGIDRSVFNINNTGLFTISESALIKSNLDIGKQEAPSNSSGEIMRLSLQPYGHTGGPWNFKARDIPGVAFLDIMYGAGNAMTINSNLNVGIGTTSPSAKLEIIGSTSNVNGYVDGHVQVVSQDPIAFIGQSNLNPSLNRWGIRLRETGDGDFSIRDNTNNLTRLLIKSTGNVGIGTTTPDARLTVNGNIHAKEVKIDLSVPAPDYVFTPDYKLKTLQEVEDYIKANSHLPEIPSAEAIEKNGLMLGEMNMSLLKKVEELTLYAIEQEKKINTQSVIIETLLKENESFKKLSERLSTIEKELKTKN